MISIKSYGVSKGSTRTSVSIGGGSVTYNYGSTSTTATEAEYATTAGYADEAAYAEKAGYADEAGNAATADYATSAGNAVHANIADEISDDSELYERFLRKDVDDEAAGVITLDQGFVAGADTTKSVDGSGNAVLASVLADSLGVDGKSVLSDDVTVGADVGSSKFDEDTQVGFKFVGSDSYRKYKLFVHNLEVWGKAIFHELEIRKISYVGGDYVFSSAGSTIFKTETVDGGIKCWLLADDGTTATQNTWQVYDQALCQTFDVDEGVYEDVANKYYWRLVTAVSDETACIYDSDGNELYDGQKFHWIVLADNSNVNYYDTSSEDLPAANDIIVQLGHQPLESEPTYERSGALMITTSGDEAGFIVYNGIYTFSLDGCVTMKAYPSAVSIRSNVFSWISGGVEKPVSVNWGEWQEGTTYPYYSTVTHNGYTWLCVNTEGTTEEPTEDSDDWLCMTSAATSTLDMVFSAASVLHKYADEDTKTVTVTVYEGSTALDCDATSTVGAWRFGDISVPDGMIYETADGALTLTMAADTTIEGDVSVSVVAWRQSGTSSETLTKTLPVSTVADGAEGADGSDGTSPVILTATPSDVVLKYGVARTIQLRLFDGSTEIPSVDDTDGAYPYFVIGFYDTPDGCDVTIYRTAGIYTIKKTTTDDISGSFDVMARYFTAADTYTDHTITIGYTTAEDGEAAEAGYAAVTVTPSISSFVHSYGYEETVNVAFTVYEGVTELFFDETGTASCWRITSSTLDENGDGTLSQTFAADEATAASYKEVIRVYRSDGTYQDFTLYITATTVYDAQAAWSVQVSPAVIAIETDDEGNLPTLGLNGEATALITVYRGNSAVTITAATYKAMTECSPVYQINDDGTMTVAVADIDDGDTYTYYTGETDSDGNRKTAEYIAPAGAGSFAYTITAEDNGTTWSADVTVAFTVSVTKLVASIWASNSQIWLGVDNVTDGLEATGISIEDKTITVTADNFKVQDNSGEEHVSITEDGGITFTGDSFKVQDEDGTERIATTAGGEIALSGEDSEGTVSMSLTGKGLVLTHASGAQIMLTFSAGVPIVKAYDSSGELIGDLHLASSDSGSSTANTYYFVVSSCAIVHASSKNSSSDASAASVAADSGVATASTAASAATYTHTYTVTAVLYVLNNGTATIASTDITVTAEVGNTAATLSAASSASVAAGASASFKYTGTVTLTTTSSVNPYSSGFLSARYASEDVANTFITIT